MRRVLLVGVVLAFVAGGAYATDYTWLSHKTTSLGSKWTSPASWDVGVGFPKTTGDRAIIRTGGSVYFTADAPTTQFTCGDLLVDNGSNIYRGSQGYTLTVQDNATAGTSGNFWYTSTAAADFYFSDTPTTTWTWDVSGNFWYNPGSISGGPPAKGFIIMRGNDKGFKWNSTSAPSRSTDIIIYGQRVWDNASNHRNATINTDSLIVKTGGSIGGAAAGTTSYWTMKYLVLEGPNPQDRLPALGANAKFRFQLEKTDNNSTKLVLTGGVQYPNDVEVGANYWNNTVIFKNPVYTWRMKTPAGGGNTLTVGQDLLIRSPGGSSNGIFWVDTVENGTASTYRNLTVNRDLVLTQNRLAGNPISEKYNLRMNSSTVRVGRSLTLSVDNTVLDMGSGNLYVGGDFAFATGAVGAWAKANWISGTSTVICDGNGTTVPFPTSGLITNGLQTLRLQGDDNISLYNLRINSRRTVQLAGNAGDGDLLLKGNLNIDNSTFKLNGRTVTFTGKGKGLTLAGSAAARLDATTAGSTLVFQGGGNDNASAQFISMGHANGFDNTLGALRIQTGSPTFVQLLTDVKVTSLVIDNGCGVVLNGHTLMLGSTPFTTTQPYSSGNIYAQWSDVAPIPEPGTMLLIGTGLIGLIGWLRRRRMK